jgi:cytochrome oxidase Cu insertion factor (SCO1/SenC/PrrC family)
MNPTGEIRMMAGEKDAMFSLRDAIAARISIAITTLAILAGALTATGCRQLREGSQGSGGFAMIHRADCLPDITLLDQHGRKVSLASLKGKPVLFDFIYTSCPGPCLVLTARMKQIANQLGPALGSRVRFVSISVDPEHDQPPQLLTYANNQAANLDGWLFLTGTPKQIDDAMARFNLTRESEADMAPDHALEFFLVGPDGRALLQYLGNRATSERIASDMERAAAGQTVTASDGSVVKVTL